MKPASVGAETLVYAVGDIHGRSDLLARLHERLMEDASRREASRRVVVFLGDYIDRGPDSHGVVQWLADGPPEGFEWIFLRGNHEEFLLRFLEDASIGLAWFLNGGNATVRSYLGRVPADFSDMEALRRDLKEALPPPHLDFLNNLRLFHIEGNFLFVHAGIRPGVPLDQQSAEDLVWIREEFLSSREDHGFVVVHGHCISRKPSVAANRIGIDTGAYLSGVLTALCLQGDERRFIQS